MTVVKRDERNYDDIKAEFERALRLRDEGNLIEAETLLSRLAEKRPDVAAVHGVLGHVHDRLGKLREAADSFRRATNLSPGSELASISLFHALYELRDLDAAFEEMRRFRRRGPSPEYGQLISDLKLELPEES
jgi:predicted Zn-dependent protease